MAGKSRFFMVRGVKLTAEREQYKRFKVYELDAAKAKLFTDRGWAVPASAEHAELPVQCPIEIPSAEQTRADDPPPAKQAK